MRKTDQMPLPGCSCAPRLADGELGQSPLGLHHEGLGEVSHDVETQAVDAVVAHPVEDVVEDQPGHHAVLRCRVVAARRVQHTALLGQAVVVPRDELVEDRVAGVGPRSVRVVVHHVNDHVQADLRATVTATGLVIAGNQAAGQAAGVVVGGSTVVTHPLGSQSIDPALRRTRRGGLRRSQPAPLTLCRASTMALASTMRATPSGSVA